MNKKVVAALSILSAFGCTSKNQPIDTTGFVDSYGDTYKVLEKDVKERVYGSRGVRIRGPTELKAGETYVFVVEGSTGNVIVFGAPDKDIDIGEDYKSFVRSIDGETKKAKGVVKGIYQLQDARDFLSEIEDPLLEIGRLLNGSTDRQVEKITRNLGYDWPIDSQYEKIFLYTSPGGGGEVLKFTDAIHEISVTVNRDTTLEALQVNPNKTEDGWRISEAALELDLEGTHEITESGAADVQEPETQISDDGWIIPDEVNSSYDMSDPEQAILAYIEASNNADRELLEKILPLKFRIENTTKYMKKLKSPLSRVEYLFGGYVTNKNSRIEGRRERADEFRIQFEQIISENQGNLEKYFEILQRIFSHVDDSVYMPAWSEYRALFNSFEEMYRECENMSRQEMKRFVKSRIPPEMIPGVWELNMLNNIKPKGTRYVGIGLPEGFKEHFIEVYKEHANFLRLFGIDKYPSRYKPPFDEFSQPNPENVLDIVNFCAQFYTQDPGLEITYPFHGILELTDKVEKFKVIDVSDSETGVGVPFMPNSRAKKVKAEVGYRLSEEEKGRIPKDPQELEKLSIELEKGGIRIEGDIIIRKLPFTILYEGSNTHVRLWD